MREAVSGWEEKDQDERRGIRMIGEGSGWVKDQNKRSSIRIRGEGSEWEKQYPDKRRRIRMREAVSGWEGRNGDENENEKDVEWQCKFENRDIA